MSGLFLVFNREGAPVERAVVEEMAARLQHRGPDGFDVKRHEFVAAGHLHFWTTPEEVGECQPLSTADGRFMLLFDGRLDNRPELLADLGFTHPEDRRLSDAALLLAAFERWEEHCFERLLGPAALVIYDHLERRVVAMRDPLGDRGLFYYLDHQVLVIASEPYAVLAHPNVSGDLDKTSLAFYFIERAPTSGRTFFKAVNELPGAHTLVVTPTSAEVRRYWDPAALSRLHCRSDDEYAAHYRDLFTASVRSRLRAVGEPAVLMSGGLDSSSVAAVAAGEINSSAPLRTVSFIFNELTSCDERRYIDEITRSYNTEPVYVNGDDAWPLRDWQFRVVNPNFPETDPFHLLLERSFEAARLAGSRVVLSGMFSDHFYSGWEDWLADLLFSGRLLETARSVQQIARQRGLRRLSASPSLRRLGRRLLEHLPASQRVLRTQDARPPAWLTPPAADIIMAAAAHARATHPLRNAAILSGEATQVALSAHFYASQHAIDVRYPYRDRRLVEFMLALPAHQLYRFGVTRPIQRRGMLGILPEAIRTRPDKVALWPLLHRGIAEKEWPMVQAWMSFPDTLWRSFIEPNTFSSHQVVQGPPAPDLEGKLITLFRCLAAGAWESSLPFRIFSFHPAGFIQNQKVDL